MNEPQKSVRSWDRGNEDVCVCIVVCLAEAREEEGYCKERERGKKCPENVGQHLEKSSYA